MLAWFKQSIFSSYVEAPFIIPRAQKTGGKNTKHKNTFALRSEIHSNPAGILETAVRGILPFQNCEWITDDIDYRDGWTIANGPFSLFLT